MNKTTPCAQVSEGGYPLPPTNGWSSGHTAHALHTTPMTMTTATVTERTTLKSPEGFDLVVVQEHNRALPGQAGSDWKPVLVHEHLRRLVDGKEVAYRTGWRWATGELSAELVEAMANVQGITDELPPRHPWTLEEATYCLTHGMRLKKRGSKWAWGYTGRSGRNGLYQADVWFPTARQCMDYMDAKVLPYLA